MCVKLSSGDLNSGFCFLHPTSTYTCEMTTTPRVHSGINEILIKDKFTWNNIKIVYFKFLYNKKKTMNSLPTCFASVSRKFNFFVEL